MKILIASDHAGFKAKEFIKENFSKTFPLLNVKWEDLGTLTETSVDYPDIAQKVCEGILAKQTDFGVLVCGSGIGVSIKANRYKGIRAALCWDNVTAELARRHNNANILCMGGRLVPFGNLLEIIQKFLTTEFEGGRHQLRINKFD